MTQGPSSEPQKAFIVAAAVLLGLPFILMIGMAAIVMAAAHRTQTQNRRRVIGGVPWRGYQAGRG